jgi:hypothetical protein
MVRKPQTLRYPGASAKVRHALARTKMRVRVA